MPAESQTRANPDGGWTRAESAAGNAEGAFDAALGTVKDSARRIAEQKKNVGADRLDEVARAVHGAARDIQQGLPQAAEFVEDAAARLEAAAAALRARSIDDVVRGLNDFARDRPAAFFAGTVLAGFALTRFFKSSAAGGSESQAGEK
jgi:hypothetical protein